MVRPSLPFCSQHPSAVCPPQHSMPSAKRSKNLCPLTNTLSVPSQDCRAPIFCYAHAYTVTHSVDLGIFLFHFLLWRGVVASYDGYIWQRLAGNANITYKIFNISIVYAISIESEETPVPTSALILGYIFV